MIAAYADGYRVLKDERYRQAAEKAADFLLAKLRDPERPPAADLSRRPGQAAGLPRRLRLPRPRPAPAPRRHRRPRRLDQARSLTDRMIADFADPQDGGFFFTADDHESLLARPKDPYDGALPGANSVAVLNLMALHRATRRDALPRPGGQDARRVQHVARPESRGHAAHARRAPGISRCEGPRPTGSSPGPGRGGSRPRCRPRS